MCAHGCTKPFLSPNGFTMFSQLMHMLQSELMIMASHQTFSGQLWHLTDQTKFDQTNLLYYQWGSQ